MWLKVVEKDLRGIGIVRWTDKVRGRAQWKRRESEVVERGKLIHPRGINLESNCGII